MNRKHTVPLLAALVLAFGLFWFLGQRRTDLSDQLERILTGENKGTQGSSSYGEQIRAFYAGREYLEVWILGDHLSKQGKALLEQIEDAKHDGLQPSDYNLEHIYEFSTSPERGNQRHRRFSPDEKAHLELLMTDGFFNLAHDLERGKVSPSTLDSSWKFGEKEATIDYFELLQEVAGGASVRETFEKLSPTTDLYAQGKKAIMELCSIKTNNTLSWDRVRVDKAIKVGERHPAIPSLRSRLIFWGFLRPYKPDDLMSFDSAMFVGLQKYQEANGMKPDGVIGLLVVESLNNSPQDLIDIASVNMERLRWMPTIDWDEEMVLVNIANYQLDYLRKSDTAFSAKVIVGKEYSESPTFTAPMSYIVFSPYWNIPESIVKDEIIPSARRNGGYLEEKNMEVVDGAGELISPAEVNWDSEEETAFPYRVRQKPGGDNSLGLVKFMFPNEYNIYIHDTPVRSLFERETRALSHGCIRIQHPEQFAKILLDDPNWDEEKILEAMNKGEEQTVKLNRKIPVVLLYLTFWADKEGKANFRSDVYGRDAALLKALRSKKSDLDET